MVYNPGYWGNEWLCEDKLKAKKPGLYIFHRLSFAKILF